MGRSETRRRCWATGFLGSQDGLRKRNENLTIVSVRYYWAVEALGELWSENAEQVVYGELEPLARDISTVSVRIRGV
jgi:hypothetical protein